MDFFNSLSPHPWLQAIVFWDFPLANSFGRALPAGFQLVRLCAVRVGAARPGCGFPEGIPLLSVCMGTTSPLCTHVSSTGYQKKEKFASAALGQWFGLSVQSILLWKAKAVGEAVLNT